MSARDDMNSTEPNRPDMMRARWASWQVARAALVAAGILCFVFWVSLPLSNLDYSLFLDAWITALDETGLAGTLGAQVSNYTAPYVVVLGAVNAVLPTASTLTVMHATGLVLHLFLTAVLVLAAIQLRAQRPPAAILMMAALAPTSVVNGPVWGQSDAFFCGFVLLAFLATVRERWLLAFAAFSAALSIKLVAIFAAPAFLVLLARRGALRKALWFPPILLGVYLALNMPYVLSGVPVGQVLGIYADQAVTFDTLSMNAPNPWYILQYYPATMPYFETRVALFSAVGIGIGAVVGLGICSLALRGPTSSLTATDQLWLLAMSAMILPFVLSKMHDRYFFLAETAAWLLAIIDRRFLPAALLAQAGSLSAYTGFLSFTHPYLPLPPLYMVSFGAILMGAAIVTLAWTGWRIRTWKRIAAKS